MMKYSGKSMSLPLAIIAGLTLSACGTTTDKYTYSSREVGSVQRVERGVVESYRWVKVDRTDGTGAVAGATVGALAGAETGKGANGIFGAVVGAIIGGAIGDGIEKGNKPSGAFEYLIRTDNGRLITVVQADKVPLGENAPVIINYGKHVRVYLDDSRIDYSDGYTENY